MKITKSYIDMLRYVSISGKKSVTQTSLHIPSPKANLKYIGNSECKSVPIGMPKKNKMYIL